MDNKTCHFGFEKFLANWCDSHPGQGMAELGNAILEEIDRKLAAIFDANTVAHVAESVEADTPRVPADDEPSIQHEDEV